MTETETTSVFGYKPGRFARMRVECSPDIYKIIQERMPELNVDFDFFTYDTKGKEADILLLGTEQCGETDLERRPSLKCISRIGSGIDNIQLRKAKIEQLVVTETYWTSKAVVEYDMAGLYQWASGANVSVRELTVGIIGAAGHIGSELFTELCGKAHRILGNDILSTDPAVNYEVDYVCKNSDILFVHIPSNAENCGYINGDLLDMLGDKPIIAPVRDAVVDWEGIRGPRKGKLLVDCELPENKEGLDFVVSTHHSATRKPYYFNRMIRAAITNGFEKVIFNRRLHEH